MPVMAEGMAKTPKFLEDVGHGLTEGNKGKGGREEKETQQELTEREDCEMK